jgi:hypothetical protein
LDANSAPAPTAPVTFKKPLLETILYSFVIN